MRCGGQPGTGGPQSRSGNDESQDVPNTGAVHIKCESEKNLNLSQFNVHHITCGFKSLCVPKLSIKHHE